MANYIFCSSKANKPMMDVRVCQARCPNGDSCPELSEYLQKTEPGFMPPQNPLAEKRLAANGLKNVGFTPLFSG